MKPRNYFLIVFSIAMLVRIWYSLQPTLIWWDAAMYIGIGKYIFTNGMIGIFEIFRPPLWPLIMGTLWKFDLPAYGIGMFFEVIATAGLFVVVYKIGERIQTYAGVVAATLLAMTQVFFSHMNIPITDIPSVLFSLLAMYFVMKDKWFIGGLFVSLAFVLRFPHAMTIVAIVLYAILLAYTSKNWKSYAKKAIVASLGALVLIGPYLIWSQLTYGNALLPIKGGVDVVSGIDSTTYDHIFYFREMLKQNFFLIFGYGIILLLPFTKKFKFRSELWLLALSALIGSLYFSQIPHKEVRYAMAFMPQIMLLASYALVILTQRISQKNIRYALVGILALFFIGTQFVFYRTHRVDAASLEPMLAFQNFFNTTPGAKLVTNYPMVVATNDVRIEEVSSSWEEALDAYTRRKEINTPDYYMFNSCMMGCQNENTCKLAEATLTDALNTHYTKVFDSAYVGCKLQIFETTRPQ
jgi:hypothetical protein